MAFPANKPGICRLAALLLTVAVTLPGAKAGELSKQVAQDYDQHLGELFRWFHRNPELSFKEVATAARLADELRQAGAEVTTGIGRTGVVGIMRNGDGPLVLVRADMDGLPIKEQSGLDYASVATQLNNDGVEVPVMHACGHDVHITSLVGVARRLAAMQNQWSGTVMLVGQPAEERISGAGAMLDDGLYEKFGVPDYALALHVSAGGPSGKIATGGGTTHSSSDSVDIIVKGVGTHGASPQKGKDPIYIAAQIIVALQSLVSREINPMSPGVVTVGAIHGGIKHNIIPGEVKLQLTMRADTQDVRDQILDGIKRIATGVARTHGVPEELLPEVRVLESTPATENDPALAARVIESIANEMGEDIFYQYTRESMGAEDFSYFLRTEHNVPGTYFSVGGTPQSILDDIAAGKQRPVSHHSPFFKIEPRPAVVNGTAAMTAAVLDLLAP